jgi:hypothetical protein
MSSAWTPRAYAIFRLGFGAYLLLHFLQLLPWGTELFSREGLLPETAMSPLTRLFPNLLTLNDSPLAVTLMIAMASVASCAFALGWGDRAAAVVMWYVLACLFGRNPLIANPSLPYLGLVLLGHAIMPSSGPLFRRGRGRAEDSSWQMCPGVYALIWALMAVGYSYSGFTKLGSPSWIDGSAFRALLENPLARPGFLREALLSLPAPLLEGLTWGGLALELLFAPIAIFSRLRPWLWLAMVAMHISLIALVDFADLSLGMLALHAFTFDPAWLRSWRPQGDDRQNRGAAFLRERVPIDAIPHSKDLLH